MHTLGRATRRQFARATDDCRCDLGTDRKWRGIGPSPTAAGVCVRRMPIGMPEKNFSGGHATQSRGCAAAVKVLQGHIKPNQCPAFGKQCSPSNPLGATMVSSEGACAAYLQLWPTSTTGLARCLLRNYRTSTLGMGRWQILADLVEMFLPAFRSGWQLAGRCRDPAVPARGWPSFTDSFVARPLFFLAVILGRWR